MTKTTRLNMDVYPFRGMKIPRRTAAQRAHFDWLSKPRVRILAAVDPGFKQEALAEHGMAVYVAMLGSIGLLEVA